jgi:hypothetical protein
MLPAQQSPPRLTIEFVLYHYSRILPDELLQREDISFRVGGIPTIPVKVDDEYAALEVMPGKAMRRIGRDTLWMEIGIDTQRMRIAFPPMPLAETRQMAEGLWIQFQPGLFQAGDLPRAVHLTGTATNLPAIIKTNSYFALNFRCGDGYQIPIGFDPATGKIDALVHCASLAPDGSVDIAMEAMNWFGELNTTMHIRMPYSARIDLGSFEFSPTWFKFDNGLSIDDEIQRDTLIAGNVPGLQVHLHPVNPRPTDTLSIQLRWIGSGEPYISSHTIIERPDDDKEIRFSFALRTDVNIATDAWESQARPFKMPQLPPGRYVITQESITGKDIRDMDFLIGREVGMLVR